MELHQLRYACAVADTGSFSRAAEACNVAQPSLSQQILKLEEELGVTLFDRLTRRVRPTEAGAAFLPHARAILGSLESARASVEKASDLQGSLTIGVIPTIAPYFLPEPTGRFLKKYPDAKLRIVEGTTQTLIGGLRDLSLDIAILALPLRYKDLQLHTVRTEALFVALPKEHTIARRGTVTLKELRGESFAMLRDGHCFRDLSISACAHGRITPNIVFQSEHLSSLLGMVAAGLAVALVPEMAMGSNSECRYARIVDSRASRTIVAACLRGRNLNHVQRAFLSCIADHAAR